ncbi:MAG: DegV family protein [Candidatus Pacebacteria bacterium]|nr:DegV family protein [Candidatus Paceibacterota bacterium]
MEEISQIELQKMIIFSCEKIEKDKEQINKINVFPVPDQDTGSNLSATLNGVREALENKEFSTIGELGDSAMEGALIAAQGNTGIIYTGWLAGFFGNLPREGALTAQKLSIGFKEGYLRAIDSIQNPKKGTILDVMEAFANSFESLSKTEEKNIITIFYQSLRKANTALLETPKHMEILKTAGVVDAGGLGFLLILESYFDILKLHTLDDSMEQIIISSTNSKEEMATKRFIQILSNRYEVVSLLTNSLNKPEKIRSKLHNLGNCLDVIQIGNKTKIHIHTDSPYEVRDIIKEMGDIESLKIQDMAKEVAGEQSIEKISIGIVIDERAGLGQKIIQHYNINIIPFKIDWPEGEALGGCSICEKIKEAERQGIKTKPKINPIPAEFFYESFKEQLDQFEKVLCIVSSSKLSSNYEAALKAKEMLPFDTREKIFIIDSKNISSGQSLVVLKALELIKELRNIKDVVKRLEDFIPKISVYAVLEDKNWWKKQPNINLNWFNSKKKYYSLAEMKDGKMVTLERIQSDHFAEILFKKIEKNTNKEIKRGARVRAVIAHGDNPEDAQELRTKLKNIIKTEVPFVTITDPVTSINACPESLIVGWVIK